MVAPFHCRSETVEPLSVLGLEIRILLPADAMEDALSVFEERDGPGDGPPLHLHHDAEEVFAVLDGRYRFQLGDDARDASPGDVLVVPRETPHTFVCTGEAGGRLLVTLRPGGFEGFFREVAEAGLSPPDDMDRIVALGERYQLELLGPNPLAT